MKLKILAVVAFVAVGIGAAFVALGGLPTSAAAKTQYLTGAATTGDITNDVAATGTVSVTTSCGIAFGAPAHLAGATASASASGGSTTWTVTALKVKVGDTVKKGAVLAQAGTAELRRQFAAATADLNTANIQLAIAKDGLAAATTTVTTRQAQMTLYNAQTQVSNAQKARTDLATQIRLATLTAPIDGLVTAVNIASGLEAPSGDAIVIDSASFQVTTDVVESDLASMAVGQPASVSIGAVSAVVPGAVTAIAPTTTGSTTGGVVTYAVTVSLDHPPATVRVGMTANVTITIDSVTNVLMVPSASLRGTTGAYTVLILGTDGTPTARPVQVGLVTNTSAQIKSGLSDGEQVVTGLNTAQTGTAATTNGGGGFGGGGLGIPNVGTRPRGGN